MNSRDWVTIHKLKDMDNRYPITPDPTQPGSFLLLGYPVTVTKRMPANLNGGAQSTNMLADFS